MHCFYLILFFYEVLLFFDNKREEQKGKKKKEKKKNVESALSLKNRVALTQSHKTDLIEMTKVSSCLNMVMDSNLQLSMQHRYNSKGEFVIYLSHIMPDGLVFVVVRTKDTDLHQKNKKRPKLGSNKFNPHGIC